MLGSDLPEDTRLRVEEAEGLLQVNLLQALEYLIVAIVATLYAVVDVAILEIGEEVQPLGDLIGRLSEAREVGLVRIPIVVSVGGLYLVGDRGDRGTLAIVVAMVVVARETDGVLESLALVVEGSDTAREDVIEVLTT